MKTFEMATQVGELGEEQIGEFDHEAFDLDGLGASTGGLDGETESAHPFEAEDAAAAGEGMGSTREGF